MRSVSVALSPKAKSKLNDMLYNVDQENIELTYDDNAEESSPPKLRKRTKSVCINKVSELAPYLSNDDIRGILACHIVEKIVGLIEKEEKLLKRKINNLIRKQFDYLLSDLSRIFSEIPHFHGLNNMQKNNC